MCVSYQWEELKQSQEVALRVIKGTTQLHKEGKAAAPRWAEDADGLSKIRVMPSPPITQSNECLPLKNLLFKKAIGHIIS